MRFMSKLPHDAHKLLKCDWQSRTFSNASGQINCPTFEFPLEWIHRNVSVMSASLHCQKAFRIILYMSYSFYALPFSTEGNIVLLSTSIILVLARWKSGLELTRRRKPSYNANASFMLVWDYTHSARKSTVVRNTSAEP